MTTLKETSTKWGNEYRNRYFLDGVRIQEAYARHLLREHDHEQIRVDGLKTTKVVTTWNIGPRREASHA